MMLKCLLTQTCLLLAQASISHYLAQMWSHGAQKRIGCALHMHARWCRRAVRVTGGGDTCCCCRGWVQTVSDLFPRMVRLKQNRRTSLASWEYINRSLTHVSKNLERGRAVSFIGIHKSDFQAFSNVFPLSYLLYSKQESEVHFFKGKVWPN